MIKDIEVFGNPFSIGPTKFSTKSVLKDIDLQTRWGNSDLVLRYSGKQVNSYYLMVSVILKNFAGQETFEHDYAFVIYSGEDYDLDQEIENFYFHLISLYFYGVTKLGGLEEFKERFKNVYGDLIHFTSLKNQGEKWNFQPKIF